MERVGTIIDRQEGAAETSAEKVYSTATDEKETTPHIDDVLDAETRQELRRAASSIPPRGGAKRGFLGTAGNFMKNVAHWVRPESGGVLKMPFRFVAFGLERSGDALEAVSRWEPVNPFRLARVAGRRVMRRAHA